ncbi:MAG: hypothetical protein PHD04_03965 [Candidatus Pacebacteria bacterium]|nr:hypothetical protein [Candidatus Paceibacterota bacterium]
MHRSLLIKDSGKDYGYNRYNAFDRSEQICSTNDLDELIEAIREFFTPPKKEEPDYEAMIEERKRPTYRERAIMQHGIEIREVRG